MGSCSSGSGSSACSASPIKPMLPFLKTGRLNWLEINPYPGRHSAKPDDFYRLVEEMSPVPRLDCFARRAPAGWDVWGDEVSCPLSVF